MRRKSAAENITDSNRIGVDFLISDAQTALVLLDAAETTSNPEDRSRRVAEATHAYQTILGFLPRMTPGAGQMQTLRTELDNLANRLRKAGAIGAG